MITAKVKGLKKPDWQKLAKSHKIQFEEKNTVRYLTEKIAEKIGVDDKIVKLDDLKQAVHDKLEEMASASKKKTAEKKDAPAKKESAKKAPAKKADAKKEAKPKASTKKKSTKGSGKKGEKKATTKKDAPKPEISAEASEKLRLDHYRAEAMRLDTNFGLEQTSEDVLKLIQYSLKQQPEKGVLVMFDQDKAVAEANAPVEEGAPASGLANLRYEVEAHGGSWGEAHTEADLQQLLTALQSAGVTPNYEAVKKPDLKQGSFELKTDNIEEIKGDAPKAGEVETPAPFNPISQVGEKPAFLQEQPTTNVPVTVVDEGQLHTYKGVFLGTIRNHFRLLSMQGVLDLFKQADYPFTHVVNRHPEQANKVEIILTSGENSVRVPSDEPNEWIDING
jgi:hypothetical protein